MGVNRYLLISMQIDRKANNMLKYFENNISLEEFERIPAHELHIDNIEVSTILTTKP